jgi:FAD/FMN-containing dehydrogenase
LDKIANWNKLYGKKGFVQYQCVLPTASAFDGIKKLLETLSQHRCASFLAVLKRFGESSKGLLSFPMPGYTLALDIPFRENKTLDLLKILDDIVLSHHGRIYLAKDACLSAQHFRDMYPNYSQWLATKQKYDPNNLFTSSLAKRLQIGT